MVKGRYNGLTLYNGLIISIGMIAIKYIIVIICSTLTFFLTNLPIFTYNANRKAAIRTSISPNKPTLNLTS